MDLATYLSEHAPDFARQTIERMYAADPFWQARFGERGIQFAIDDNGHHVAYLVQAVQAQTPEVLVRYARWLQSVLTTRGMCSRHLSINFRVLAEVLASASAPDAAQAREYLDAARSALRYDGGPARTVQDMSAAIVARAVADLRARQPGAPGTWSDERLAEYVGHLEDHVAYVADGLALGRSDVYAGYVRFVATLSSHGAFWIANLAEALEVLDAACDLLPASVGAAARGILRPGRATLSTPPE